MALKHSHPANRIVHLWPGQVDRIQTQWVPEPGRKAPILGFPRDEGAEIGSRVSTSVSVLAGRFSAWSITNVKAGCTLAAN